MKHLRQDPSLLRDCNALIQEQIEKGIVEDPPPTDTIPAHVHYLPHRQVVRHDKDSIKVHVVYNA